MKILVTPTSITPDSKSPALDKLRSFADFLVFNPEGKPLPEEKLKPLLADCDGCIAGVDFFTAGAMAGADRLKVISRYGVGVDRVDIDAAKAKNIVVCNTPGANAQAVADLTIALLLCVVRKVPALDKSTREGLWPRSCGVELYRKTVGILGLGAVGKATASRAAGFSMKILACDPRIDSAWTEPRGIIPVDFNTLVRESDFLCLHLPLNPRTKGIISADVMRSMKKGAVIINTARGGLIDEAAACGLLASGHLGGLGMDVFEPEPPPKSPLFDLENVVLTPHTAAHTFEAAEAMAEMAVQNLIDVLTGTGSPHIVTGFIE